MKKLLIVVFTLLLTGCSADYTLTISEDKMVEHVEIEVVDINDEIDNICEYFVLDEREIIESELSCEETPIGAIYVYSAEFNTLNQFIEKTVFNSYLNNKVTIENNIVSIVFSGIRESVLNYDLDKFDNVKISMNVEYEVLEHNADNYNEDTNTYSWTLTKDNVEKEIKLVYDLSESTSLNTTDYMLYLILAVISVVTIVVILIVKSKNNKNNTL